MMEEAGNGTYRVHCRIIGNLADNHNGDPELARQLVEIAVSSGCDGIVLPHRKATSCYTQEVLLQPVADRAHSYTTLGESLQALELSAQAIGDLRSLCGNRISFIAAPYDLEAFAEMQAVEPDAYQIDAPVLTHIPLLDAVASSGKPVLLVAGACTEDDMDLAIKALGRDRVTLMHSVYAKGIEAGSTALWAIPHLAERFGLPMGYMGLERDTYTPVAAFAMGARTIEKYFTSDNHLPGPSHATSLDRDQLRQLVLNLRSMEPAISGDSPRILLPIELESDEDCHPALVASSDLPAGVTLDESMLSVRLATHGVGPRLLDQVVGRRLAYELPADTPISFAVMEA